MKKILLITTLLTVSLFAKADSNFLMHKIQLMQNMEVAMSTIQKGFLYNSDKLVQNGINKLKYNLQNVKSFDIKNDDRIDFDAKKYATTEIGALSNLADQLQEDFSNGNKEKILTTYHKTMNRCITCHLIVRKW